MISLADLDLDYIKSNNNLSFKLRENSKIIYAPQLSFKNDHSLFYRCNENGLPILKSLGKDRVLYTTQFGLTKVTISRKLNFLSNEEDLSHSDENSRIIIIEDK